MQYLIREFLVEDAQGKIFICSWQHFFEKNIIMQYSMNSDNLRKFELNVRKPVLQSGSTPLQ